jgi:hypothetical protein
VPDDFATAFKALRAMLAAHADRYAVKKDISGDYVLETKFPSPFPQHRGQPLFFAAVHRGKAYVSLHLMALYMNPILQKTLSPALKKRMQGKACFNFKAAPEADLLNELSRLTETASDFYFKLKK